MKNYSFIDMHIHTAYSNEDLCDISIKQLLELAQKKAERTGKDCVIAIADHNSILGVKEARNILNSPDGIVNYPNVKLINSIEFTTDLIEFCDQFDGERVFTRCHTLAYGYNEKDPELTAYSQITHKFFSKDDNVGMQICAARRAVCEHYNIDLPFSIFAPMADMNKGVNFKNEFIKLLLQYAKENNISLPRNDIDRIVTPYILNHVDYVREAASFGRLKLSDIAKLIKNAGGELVIAHPSLIRVTVPGLRKIAQKEGIELSDIYTPSGRKFNNNTDLMHVKKQKLVLEYFIDTFNKVCGGAICLSGIEKYYSNNFKNRLDKVIESVCIDKGLYETCGSDFHGLHLYPEKRLGNVFSYDIQKKYKESCGYISEDKAPLIISGLSAVEYLLNKKVPILKNETIIGDINGNIIDSMVYESLVNSTVKTHTTIPEQQKSLLSLNNRISELTDVANRFNDIITNGKSKSEQAKLLLRLNLFVENIYNALKVLKDKANDNYKIRMLPEYEQIINLMADIKNKFRGLMRNNPQMIKDLKKDMKYYYKKKNVVVHRLAELDFPASIKAETSTSSDASK